MRAVHWGLLLLVAAVVTVGWLDGRPTLRETAAEGEAPSPAARGDDRVQLAYWEKWASFEGDAAQAMADDFNRTQDEIFVHRIITSQVDRKTMLAVIGGDPPDVVGLWGNNVPSFAEGGALLPLDDFMARSGLGEDYYTPQYLQIGRFDGKTYALPSSPATVALFYNKQHFRDKADALRAAGLDPDRPPATIEELDRYAAVLTEYKPDGTPRIMGFLPTEPGWWNYAWGYYFGGTLYDPETERITTDSPENVAAYTWVKGYAEAYGREKLLRFRSGFGTFDSPQNGFIDGKVSMVMQGVWFPNFIRRHRPHMEFGVAPFPTAEGVPGPRALMECDVLAIPRGAKNPELSWKLIAYSQRRGSAILNRLQGKHMPIRNPPDLFRQGHPNLELDVFERLAASPYSFTMPRITIWDEYRRDLAEAFDHIWGWPVPESELAGLTGAARQERIRELCREEVQRTLAAVRQRIQKRFDEHRARSLERSERGDR